MKDFFLLAKITSPVNINFFTISLIGLELALVGEKVATELENTCNDKDLVDHLSKGT